jgi:hypothetical protein
MIWGSHSSNYKEFCLLEYNALQPRQLTFWRNISPPSSRLRSSTCRLLHAGFLLDLLLQAEDGAVMSLWNADRLSLDYMVLCLRRHWPQWSKAWTVFTHSNNGIVGSNPTQGMDVCVCVYSVCAVLCVGSSLATGWSVIQGVLLSV